MALEKPYVKRTASGGEVVPITDHNKQEDQLEALTVFGNRKWTTATRPTPSTDDLYPVGFNTTLGVHEGWNGAAWIPLGGAVDLDWEHIGTTRLTSPASTISLGSLSCGLGSGGAKYQALKLWIYLRANTGNVANPRLEANSDSTDANYYGAGGANDPRIVNATLLVAGPSKVIEGVLLRTNALAAEVNAYLFRYGVTDDAQAGAFGAGGTTSRGWKWLNPTPDDVLTTLDVKAPTNNFETGSQIRAEGLRPGI